MCGYECIAHGRQVQTQPQLHVNSSLTISLAPPGVYTIPRRFPWADLMSLRQTAQSSTCPRSWKLVGRRVKRDPAQCLLPSPSSLSSAPGKCLLPSHHPQFKPSAAASGPAPGSVSSHHASFTNSQLCSSPLLRLSVAPQCLWRNHTPFLLLFNLIQQALNSPPMSFQTKGPDQGWSCGSVSSVPTQLSQSPEF